MTDLARAAGRELTMDVREMPRDGIERLTARKILYYTHSIERPALGISFRGLGVLD